MSNHITLSIPNVDPELLENQRKHLSRVACDKQNLISDDERDALEGLANMLSEWSYNR